MDKSFSIQPVILCGGSGSRLWPLSREHFPKQLIPLVDELSLLQNTLKRLDGLGMGPAVLVSNEKHRFMVAEQVRQVVSDHAGIILEPVGRNTAPAIAVAALHAMAKGSDPLLLVLPADHVLASKEALHEAIEKASSLAESGFLVAFGVVPVAPETGYGYIRRGAAVGSEGFRVDKFVEKPPRDIAEQYLAEGGYYWNSGMFLFRASKYLEELARFEPSMLAACRESLRLSVKDLDFIRLDSTSFATNADNSIDYAVMERTEHAAVVPLDAGWSDIGSFSALWECSHDKGSEGNVLRGDVLTESSRNCYVNASHRLVALVGLDDVVVVETADAVLVARRDQVQDVKKIVQQLRALSREEVNTHRRVYRPWGYYEGVDQGERYQVKRIGVNPGASLSLQMHYHRAEHWIVVNGTAEVTCEDRVFLVRDNESTYIPLGQKHRLHNPGKTMLELIEVQSGSYLGEDDIVRFTDVYGRV